jgi:xylose dehydrogenase (NAD/NADP)
MSQPLLDINDDPDQWRLDPDLAGPGGSVTDLGVYSVNTARFVLEADPVAVQGATWSGTPAFESIPDERAAFTLEFPGGVLAACTASQNAHYASNFRVVGTEGELLLEPAFLGGTPNLTFDDGTTRTTIDFDGVEQTTESFRYFADHLLTETPIEGDGEHALVDVEVIDAIYDAADRGERITL